jgi:hypothetical protein
MARPSIQPGNGVGVGLLAGLVGGFVLAVFRITMALGAGGDAWHPLEMAAAPVLGERALVPGFDPAAFVLGMILHFAIAAAWGGVFGFFFHGLAARGTVIAGPLFGLVVWFTMLYVVLPLAGLSELATAVPIRDAIVAHVLFGLGVGIAYAPFQERFGEYWGPPERAHELAPTP